jgi:hypothetical protein
MHPVVDDPRPQSSSGYTVNALLPLRLRQLSEADLETHAGALEGPLVDLPAASRRSDGPDALTELSERVGSLERKVDVLIELLLRKEQQELRRRAEPIELSMERVVFRWAEALSAASSFELELVLGLLPPTELRAVVVVEDCEPDPLGGYRVTARFASLGESAADSLHRYMLTSQRRARRARGAAA